MLKFIANRKLHTALERLEAPMKLINMRSYAFQEVVENIQNGYLSPDDGARFVLNSVYRAFDKQHTHHSSYL